MKTRIRTVKPELALHEGLFDLEQETGLPIRFVWAMLPTVCDRAGRFEWRPRPLKAQLCPYDTFDFEDVLLALAGAGQIVRYEVDGKHYAYIPTFLEHQKPNNKEVESTLPEPGKSVEDCEEDIALNPEKASLDPDLVEGKGTELEGKGTERETRARDGEDIFEKTLERIGIPGFPSQIQLEHLEKLKAKHKVRAPVSSMAAKFAANAVKKNQPVMNWAGALELWVLREQEIELKQRDGPVSDWDEVAQLVDGKADHGDDARNH